MQNGSHDLPIGLQRVYGGSWWVTLGKLAGLGLLYLLAFAGGMMIVVFAPLSVF